LDRGDQWRELLAVAPPGKHREALRREFLGNGGADEVARADHRRRSVSLPHVILRSLVQLMPRRGNQTPALTAAAMIMPYAASPAQSARNKPESPPVQRSISQPPPTASTSRTRPAMSGHVRRPAPCEAK